MNVALVTANLGNFEQPSRIVGQGIRDGLVHIHRFTDENFPPRSCMHPRLQAKIPKMFAWELIPGMDLYLWIDASFTVWRPSTTQWFIDTLGDADAAFFPHTDRTSIRAEAEMLQKAVAAGDSYLCNRYRGEWVDQQLAAIPPDYPDDRLYCGGAFIYRNQDNVRAALSDWWFHTSRYHVVDQLALPYVLWKNQVNVRPLPGGFYSRSGACLFRPKVDRT